MNDAVRRDLNEVASQFWKQSPWQTLTDEEHFGIRDSETGILACCALLGHAGQEYGLGIHFGQEGFSVSRRLRTSMMDQDEFAYSADFILLSYNKAGEIPKAQRKGRESLLPIQHSGNKIIPMLWRKQPHADARPLDDSEAVFVVRALRAILELLKSKRLGGGRLRNPDDVLVFVLSKNPDLSIREERLKLSPPSPPAERPPALTLSPGTRAQLQVQTPRGTLAVAFATPGMSVQGQQVRMLMVLSVEDDQVLAGQAFMGPEALQQAGKHLVSAMLGEVMIPNGRRVPLPADLVTDSLEFYEHVKDAIADLGVRVLYQEHVPHLENVKASFSNFMKRPE